MLRGTVRSVLRAVSAAPADRMETSPERSFSGKGDPIAAWPPEAVADTVDAEPSRPRRLSEEAVRDLFSLAWRWRLTDEYEAVAAIAAMPRLATPDRALPAALHELYGETGFANTPAYAALWRHAARALLERSATPPEEPRHWKIACVIDCDCELCADLQAFCRGSGRAGRAVPAPQGASRASAPDHRPARARHGPRDRAPRDGLSPWFARRTWPATDGASPNIPWTSRGCGGWQAPCRAGWEKPTARRRLPGCGKRWPNPRAGELRLRPRHGSPSRRMSRMEDGGNTGSCRWRGARQPEVVRAWPAGCG